MATSNNIAIIGAGVAGLTLALTLQREGVPFDIYEVRDQSEWGSHGGAFTLFSNALKYLDRLGLYERLRPLGCELDDIRLVDEDLNVKDIIPTGNEHIHGYKGMRILRSATVQAMRDLLVERAGPHCIHYNAKFSRVTEENYQGVTFELADGSQHHASFVIGSDGIHSRVRKNIANQDAVYTGRLLLLTTVPTKSLRMPKGQASLQIPAIVQCAPGAMLLVHDTPDKDTVFCLRDVEFPEQNRNGWAAVEQGKERLKSLLKADKKMFNETIQSVMDATTDEGLTTGANFIIPKLPSWSSAGGRAILLGDAAHAMPPASMQGANQAIEDAVSLALVMNLTDSQPQPEILQAWYASRWDRIERIRLIGRLNEIRRMTGDRRSIEERAFLEKYPDLVEPNMAWLLTPDLEADMRNVVSSTIASQE